MRKTARICSLLMAAVLIAAQTPFVAAGEEEQSSHECTAVLLTVVDEQSHTVSCPECGAAVTEAHSFGGWNAQDSQCHVSVCTCGASMTEGHAWNDGVLDEAAGVRVYTCTACSASYTETAETSEEEMEEPSEKETKDPPGVEPTQIPKSALPGDVDGDGEITADDLKMISSISQGTLPSVTELQIKAADYNQDGCVNLADAVLIYLVLMG